MSDKIKIIVEQHSDPQLRKLARALLSLASRQQANRERAARTSPTSGEAA